VRGKWWRESDGESDRQSRRSMSREIKNELREYKIGNEEEIRNFMTLMLEFR